MNDIKRTTRKRERTRASLLAASKRLVDSRPRQKISIQDITEAADVGLGTFYNYFETKQAAYEAVLDEMRQQYTETLDTIRAPLTDPATIMAVTLRHGFNQSLDHLEWNSFIDNAGLEGEYFLQQDDTQLLEDIERGVKAGRFQVKDVQFTCNLIQGMVRHVTREVRSGAFHRAALDEATRHILRMLGIPEPVAKALTQSPLPPVAAPRRREPPRAVRNAS